MIDKIDILVALLLSVIGGFRLMLIPDLMLKIQFSARALVHAITNTAWNMLYHLLNWWFCSRELDAKFIMLYIKSNLPVITNQ